ncbi:UBX domain-containing protein 4 [Pyrus ussuriensis x Pyrus communis]|uniref:UBX domain-containing protein 4 n=1 Tax=Pyrus ussuriensis x Pyrus communis TaxID=2448454 RepID=A0A5N5GRR7_9ROSA|nr:UBX domain-containing protein 4 [Pyrus ussuriensis x Pyrus communis]
MYPAQNKTIRFATLVVCHSAPSPSPPPPPPPPAPLERTPFFRDRCPLTPHALRPFIKHLHFSALSLSLQKSMLRRSILQIALVRPKLLEPPVPHRTEGEEKREEKHDEERAGIAEEKVFVIEFLSEHTGKAPPRISIFFYTNMLLMIQAPTLEFKPLPDHLKYHPPFKDQFHISTIGVGEEPSQALDVIKGLNDAYVSKGGKLVLDFLQAIHTTEKSQAELDARVFSEEKRKLKVSTITYQNLCSPQEKYEKEQKDAGARELMLAEEAAMLDKTFCITFFIPSRFDALKGSARHLSLIPLGGGGILAHSLAHIASWLKVKEDDHSGDGIESITNKVEYYLAEGKIAEAAEAFEEGVKGTQATEVVGEWVKRARNRAITDQALTLLQSYATSISVTQSPFLHYTYRAYHIKLEGQAL